MEEKICHYFSKIATWILSLMKSAFLFLLCNSFETKLPQIFGDISEAYRNIQARLQAEQFKVETVCFSTLSVLSSFPAEICDPTP